MRPTVLLVAVVACVEINQCVGCTRQFFTKSFLGDGRAGSVERRGTGIATPSSRRRVDGVDVERRFLKFYSKVATRTTRARAPFDSGRRRAATPL